MKTALVSLLVLAYLSTLAMSTGHLAQWYALSLGGLPPWLAWGLAGSLEFTAFLLSLLSNSVLRGSAWAGGGALAALALVWLGNTLSMHRAAPSIPLWETLAMSLFVPVGTYVVGKVVGEMLAFRGGRQGVTDPLPEVEHLPGPTPAQVDHPLPLKVAPSHPKSGTVTAQVYPQGGEGVPREEGGVLHPLAYLDSSGGTRSAAVAQGEERATLRLTESRTLEWTLEGRGGELLEALGRYRAPVTLGALARELGWPKTTVRRWLDRLEEGGLVYRTPEGWTLREVVRDA